MVAPMEKAFDARLDLSFEEFCEYLKTGSAPTRGSGVESAEKHGKTLGVYDPSTGSILRSGSGATEGPEWYRRDWAAVLGVPENTGGDRKVTVWGRIRAFFNGQ